MTEQEKLQAVADLFEKAINSFDMNNPGEFENQKYYDELKNILEPEEE